MSTSATQSGGQLMPDPATLRPPPVSSSTITVSTAICWKVAVTCAPAVATVTWQVPAAPEHAPAQDRRRDRAPGSAVSVTTVPFGKLLLHPDEQTKSAPGARTCTWPGPAEAFTEMVNRPGPGGGGGGGTSLTVRLTDVNAVEP